MKIVPNQAETTNSTKNPINYRNHFRLKVLISTNPRYILSLSSAVSNTKITRKPKVKIEVLQIQLSVLRVFYAMGTN